MGVSIFFLKKVYAWDKKPAQVRTHGFLEMIESVGSDDNSCF
jgi:hypothetical protein